MYKNISESFFSKLQAHFHNGGMTFTTAFIDQQISAKQFFSSFTDRLINKKNPRFLLHMRFKLISLSIAKILYFSVMPMCKSNDFQQCNSTGPALIIVQGTDCTTHNCF